MYVHRRNFQNGRLREQENKTCSRDAFQGSGRQYFIASPQIRATYLRGQASGTRLAPAGWADHASLGHLWPLVLKASTLLPCGAVDLWLPAICQDKSEN